MASPSRRSVAGPLQQPDLGLLSPEEQERFQKLAKVRAGGETLLQFIGRMVPHEPPGRHLMPVIAALEKMRKGPQRLCISMPPRHAKTVTIVRAIAWWLLQRPADTCGYFSYNSPMAQSKSRIARALALRAGVQLSDDSASRAEWRTTAGGGLLAGGAGGGLTGQGITGFVAIDDPIKNREEADSELVRTRIWEWFNEVVMTRLEYASVIVTHTRWHEDDLIGRLEDQGGWTVIRLPAIAEAGEPDLIGRKPGEALWEKRFPAARLGTEPGQPNTLRGQIGEFSFSALYQQRPRPRGAKLFGAASYFDPATFDLHGWKLLIAADPAASEKTSADWSVAGALAYRGHRPELEFRLLEVYRKQVSIPEFARALRALQLAWHMAPIYVEAVGGFKAVPQLLREQDPELLVFEAPALGDKFQRAQLASAAWNAHPSRLLVPLGAPPWLAAVLHELQRFTGVKDVEDDIVDMISHGVNAASLAPEPATFEGFGRSILPSRV